MKIEKLIMLLHDVQNRHGNIECVQEIEDFFGNKIDSTIEDIVIVNFQGEKAAKIDWRR